MKVIAILSFVAIAGLSGCSSTSSEPGDPAPLVFRLDRNCAMCVAHTNYTVDIHSNGLVLFRWKEDIEPKEHRYTISTAKIDSLAAAFVSAGIYDFSDSYHQAFDSTTGQWYTSSDGPADALYFNYNSQIKTISSISYPPNELDQLLEGIDIIANTAQWKE